MPVDTQGIADNFAKKVVQNKYLYSGIRNPFLTALMISFIIVLVTLFVYRDADTYDSKLKTAVRNGLYCGAFVLVIVFLHNKFLMEDQASEHKNAALDDIFDNVSRVGDGNLVLAKDVMPINDIGKFIEPAYVNNIQFVPKNDNQ